MKIILENDLKIELKDLNHKLLRRIKKELVYPNPEYFKIKNMGKSTHGIVELIQEYTCDNKFIYIPRGSIYMLRRLLSEFNINNYEIIDKRTKIKSDNNMKCNIKPRDYQLKSATLPIKYQNCIICAVCGAGKTKILLHIISKLKQRTLVIVPDRNLMNQWIDNIKESFEDGKDIVGQWGDGIKKINDITIAIVNSANNDSEYLSDKFGAIIVDEAHRSPSQMFDNVIGNSKAFYRIGATATPYRKDGLEFKMHNQFGKIISEIDDNDMYNSGFRIPVEIQIVLTEFGISGHLDWNNYLSKSSIDNDRNDLIFDMVNRDVKNGHYGLVLNDRLEFCHKFNDRLNNSGIESLRLVGGRNKELKEEGDLAINRLREGNLQIAVGNSVAEEGLDIERLDRLYITTPTAGNKRRFMQTMGRIARISEGKEKAICYYFLDKGIKMTHGHIRNIMRYVKGIEIYSVFVIYEGIKYPTKEFLKKFNLDDFII